MASRANERRSIRLDALLARCGYGTRKDVRRLIRSGEVTLDGEVCRLAGQWVGERRVCVRGEPVEAPPDALHLALHKPVGYACSHDEREAPLLYDLVPAAWQGLGLEAAGRLDRATSGLIVLSTDGGWIHRLTHPARKVGKRYRIEYAGQLAEDAVQRCLQGIELGGDEPATAAADLVLDGPGRATLQLREGRHHQVRRMIAALGAEVTALHRDRIGSYELPRDLAPGEAVRLDEADLERLVTDSSL